MLEKIQRIKTILSQEYTKAALYYIVANIIGQGVVLLSSGIFSRMMSKADYGLVSTYSAWVLILNTFICLNLFVTIRNAYIDFYDDYDRFNSSVLLLSIVLGIGVSAIILCFAVMFRFKTSKEEIILACIQAIALNIINYKLAIQSMKNEYKQRSLLLIAPNWIHIILSILFMLIFTSNLYMSKIRGNAVGILLFGILCAFSIFKKASPTVIIKYWKYALILSTPLIFHTLADLILIQSDRLMLTTLIGPNETAEYSIIYNVGYIVVTIGIAINGAWLPFFFKEMSKKDLNKIKGVQNSYIYFFTIFTCGVLTFSPELIKIISPKNYWGGIYYTGLIILASYFIFIYTLFTCYLTYMKKMKTIARNTIIAALLNIILNYYLIPRYSAIGAAATTIISYFVLFSLHYLSLGRYGRQLYLLQTILINLFVVFVYSFIFYFIYNQILARYMLFVFYTISFLFIKGKKLLSKCI